MDKSGWHSWRKNLSAAARSDLEACQTSLKLIEGQYLYHYGDPAKVGYEVVTGQIEIRNTLENGRKMLLQTLSLGDSFGELALVDYDARLNDAVANTATVLNVLTRDDFVALCEKHSEIPLAMARMLGRHYRVLFSMVQDANLLSLYQRLGRHILRLSLRQAVRCDDGTLLLKNCSQETLGEMVGSVRQSVGRELKKMNDSGLISIEFKSIRIMQPNKMITEFGQELEQEPMMGRLISLLR